MSRGYGVLLGVQALLLAALLSVGLWHPGWGSGAVASAATGPMMRGFANEADLTVFLTRARVEQVQQLEVAEDAAEAATDAAAPAQFSVAEPEAPASDSITNVQTAGVDEGGILKMRGRYLVVLRRGRLFTIDTADELRTISMVDAFPPGVDGEQAWYDEMLISGDMVVVIGFNYARAGTEINRFRIDDAGRLTYRDTYTLRSNDYYSSENYASRLIGDELIVYSPLALRGEGAVMDSLPAVARYDAQARQQGAFDVIAEPGNIYVAPDDLQWPGTAQVAHSVSRCDLSADTLDCDAIVVLGGWSRSFYVGSDAVYVWTQAPVTGQPHAPQAGNQPQPARVYRLPLNGNSPGMVEVAGMPTDQFSFNADTRPGASVLYVLTSAGAGDAMWDSESGGGPMRLLSLPIARFSSGNGMAEAGLYRTLPPVQGYGLQNRFVGDYVLYSRPANPTFDARGIGSNNPADVVVVPLDGGDFQTVRPGHTVSRIDIMGDDAVVIGDDEGSGPIGLNFSTVSLGATPAIVDRFQLPSASESEGRSHAFFYRADPRSTGGRSGTLGLPIRYNGANPDTDRASVLYLRRADRRLSELGQLAAQASGQIDDGCRASCADWYGNARPIFAGNRIFALLGYELVEGRMEQGQIREVRRLDFAPRQGQARQ